MIHIDRNRVWFYDRILIELEFYDSKNVLNQ